MFMGKFDCTQTTQTEKNSSYYTCTSGSKCYIKFITSRGNKKTKKARFWEKKNHSFLTMLTLTSPVG